LKKVVEKFGIPQFVQFHERLLLSSISYILSSIPWIPELSNTYSELEISNDSENESNDNIGLPTYISSPIQKNQTQSSSTTKKKQGKNKKDTHTSKNSEPVGIR
jgi:hypothetical protein